MLEQFPGDGVAGETLLKVRELLDDIKSQQAQGQKSIDLIEKNIAAIKSDAIRKEVEPLVSEIKAEMNINTLDRMADFLRLADDPKMSPEQKMSLAVSGWLLGSGAAIDNLAVSTSLVKVRDLVRQYMTTTRDPDRDEIIARLTSIEGATNENISKLLAHMKPPLPTEVLEQAACRCRQSRRGAWPAGQRGSAASRAACQQPEPGRQR